MFKIFVLLSTFLFVAQNAYAIGIGNVKLAQNRLPINLKQFKINTLPSSGFDKKTKIYFVKDSVQWVRSSKNLLTPRALLKLRIYDPVGTYHISYKDEKILPQKRKKVSETSLYIDLFESKSVFIFQGKKKVASIYFNAEPQAKSKKTQLIDYSCSRYGIKIKGLDNEYVSVGCMMERTGPWHGSKPRLQITWSATNYELLDGTSPPFVGYLHRSGKIVTQVRDRNNNVREISIQANIPKKLPRMFTAYGFGPYALNANQTRDGEKIDNKSRVAPALFLYGKYELAGTASFKFFDAFIANKAIFNNAGLYFSYQLAEVYDGRIEVQPLLGFQLLSFRINDDNTFQQTLIYPQGFEFTLKHAFGIENYNIAYGMFISPSSDHEYRNLWVRWGKGYFWELNYIGWEYEGAKSLMYGLSIGLPLATFF